MPPPKWVLASRRPASRACSMAVTDRRPGAAIDHDLRPLARDRELRGIETRQRIEQRAGDMAGGIFLRLAHVDEQNRAIREAGLERVEADVVEGWVHWFSLQHLFLLACLSHAAAVSSRRRGVRGARLRVCPQSPQRAHLRFAARVGSRRPAEGLSSMQLRHIANRGLEAPVACVRSRPWPRRGPLRRAAPSASATRSARLILPSIGELGL